LPWQTPERSLGSGELFGAHAEINIAAGTQTQLRVKSRYRPAFHENRLDLHCAQQRDDLCDCPLLKRGLERVQAIRLVESLCRGNVAQGGMADAPPSQCPRSRAQQQRRNCFQFCSGALKYWWRVPPRARKRYCHQATGRLCECLPHGLSETAFVYENTSPVIKAGQITNRSREAGRWY